MSTLPVASYSQQGCSFVTDYMPTALTVSKGVGCSGTDVAFRQWTMKYTSYVTCHHRSVPIDAGCSQAECMCHGRAHYRVSLTDVQEVVQCE